MKITLTPSNLSCGGGGELMALLRVAFAPALFALLAASVSGNAAAQTEEINCTASLANSNFGGNPHDLSQDQGSPNCLIAAGSTGSRITDPANNRCGSCAFSTSSFCTNPGIVRYTFNGGRFCGPQARCDSIGGLLEDNNRCACGDGCTCDPGTEKVNGVCILDCPEGERRLEIGGSFTCVPEECESGQVRNSFGACVAASNSLCPPRNTVFNDPEENPVTLGISSPIHPPDRCSFGQYGITDLTNPQCGTCQPLSECVEHDEYVIYSNNFCGPLSQCAGFGGGASRQVLRAGESIRNSFLSCHGECEHSEQSIFRNNTPDILRDDFCAVPATCANTHRRDDANACIPLTAGDCQIWEHFTAAAAGGTCAPRVAGNCPPEEQFTDDTVNGGGTCAPRVQADCPDGREFMAAENPADGGTCVQCLTNEVSTGGAECRCDPDTHYPNAEEGTCDEITTSCPGVQERVVDNVCAECPANQHLVSGACQACPENERREMSMARCSCPSSGHAVINERCLVLAVAPEHHTACYTANWRMPIASSTVSMDCRAAEDTQEDVTACISIAGTNFIAVLDGVCANSGGCTGGGGQLTPEVVSNDSERNQVGSCITGENCQGRGGVVNADLECRLPTNNMECMRVSDDAPIHHDGAAGNCVAACGPGQAHNDDAVCECDGENNYINLAGSGEPLNCQMRCDADEIRNTEDVCEACGANEVPNAESDECICAGNFERNDSTMVCDPRVVGDCAPDGIFTAADPGPGGTCSACPEGEEPVNNACVAECREDQTRNDGVCGCPGGQRENSEQTACEAIPASGGGSSSNGAVIALVAVPAVLIGGYYLLGGFDYIDPAYGLDYSGENGDLDWRGNAGFNLRHGGLSSYASAVQSNGDAVSYESGISYERDFLSLTYDAAESESEYLYDLGASVKAEFGLWTISPTAAAEFQYRTSEEAWDSESSAGVSAAWAAHRWIVRARSAFAGSGAGHEVDLEFRF